MGSNASSVNPSRDPAAPEIAVCELPQQPLPTAEPGIREMTPQEISTLKVGLTPGNFKEQVEAHRKFKPLPMPVNMKERIDEANRLRREHNLQ